jgi:hypothetical protein
MAKLNEKAMLVHLRVSMWTGSKKDSRVSSKVCHEYEAEQDAGSWWTYFIPKKELKEVQSAANRLRNEWKRKTLPWMDEGVRIIPSELFLDYSTRMREAMERYNQEVENFLDRYPTIIANMPSRLKGLLDNKNMPTVTEVRMKFGARMGISPIPDATDFRVDLGEEEMMEIRKQSEETMREMASKAMGSVWKQLTDMVAKIEATLSDPDKKFKDSLLGNLIDLCIQLPKLNLVEDQNLEEVRKEAINKLCVLAKDMEELRKNKVERKAAAKTAKELMEKMSAYSI